MLTCAEVLFSKTGQCWVQAGALRAWGNLPGSPWSAFRFWALAPSMYCPVPPGLCGLCARHIPSFYRGLISCLLIRLSQEGYWACFFGIISGPDSHCLSWLGVSYGPGPG
jgi:hypothetical protein